MAKLVLTDLVSLANQLSVVNTLNNNNALIEAALEKTLSRDGTSPNMMGADLDMNSNQILNLSKAVEPTEPIRKQEFDELIEDLQDQTFGIPDAPLTNVIALNDLVMFFDISDNLHRSIRLSDIPFQPLDADLTSIAGLSTTAYGRGLLTSVDATTLFNSIKQAATATATGVVELTTAAEVHTGTDTTRAITAATLFAAEVSVASATTTNLGAAASKNVRITGTTTITSFGTGSAGLVRNVRFADALTLTRNATSLILPGGTDIRTAAGDTASFISLGSGNWYCLHYTPATGGSVVEVDFYVRAYGAIGDATHNPTTDAYTGTDDSAAIAACIAAAVANGGGNVVFTPGKSYRVTTIINITSSNICINLNGATILCDLPESETSGVFRFNGTGTTSQASTTATVAPVRDERSLTVASATGFAIGDHIQITSTEYFNGITGVSGYTPTTKGELNRVRFIAGNVITVETPFRDNYSITGQTVTVRKSLYLERGKICNGTMYGTGNGVTHTSSNPTGVRGVNFNYVDGVIIENMRFLNFARYAATDARCKNVKVISCDFVGRDLRATDNAAVSVSEWFTGHASFGSESITRVNCTGSFCRRPFDEDVSSGVIPRTISEAGNTSISCFWAGGGHHCQGVSIVGLSAHGCNNGYVFRGKDLTFVGNNIDGRGSYGVKIGGYGDDMNYDGLASSGDVFIVGNKLRADDIGVWNTVSTNSLVVDENILALTTSGSRGVLDIARNTSRGSVSRNLIYSVNPSALSIAIYFPNNIDNGGSRLTLTNMKIDSNTILGTSQGIIVEGTNDRANPAENISMDNNTIEATLRAMGFTATSTDEGGDLGWYGSRLSQRNNTFLSNPSSNTINNTSSNRFIVYPDQTGSKRFDKRCGAIANQDDTTLTSVRSIQVGDYIENIEPGEGEPLRWVCTVPGTTGTLSSVTGYIAASSTTLNVSAITNLHVGTWVRVPGAGVAAGNLDAIITAVDVSSVTLSVAASTAVLVGAPASISYLAPVFVPAGMLGNVVRGPSTSTDTAVPKFNGTEGNLLSGTSIYIDSSNRLLVNRATANTVRVGTNDRTPFLQVQTSSSANNGSLVGYWANDNVGPTIYGSKSRTGTVGAHTIVQDGDSVLTISGQGSDGAKYVEAARIEMRIAGTPGTSSMPGEIAFRTTSNGAETVTTRINMDATSIYPQTTGVYALGKSTLGFSNAFFATGAVLSFNNTDTITHSAGLFTSNAPMQINADSTSPGLLINQLGTGAAIRVEDSATPDATPFIVDAAGGVTIGHTAQISTVSGTAPRTPVFQVIGTGDSLSSTGNNRFSDDNGGATFYFSKSRNATIGSHTIVNNNDFLGILTFAGSDGAKMVEAARITVAIDGAPGTDDMPGRIIFSTTPDGSNLATEKFRISNTGLLTGKASLLLHSGTAVPAGGTAAAGLMFSSTANLGIFFGSGAPTLSAAQGSIYLRTNGSGTANRLYVNTDGSTTWTNFTSAA